MTERPSISPLWWLWLPVALALALAISGQLWPAFYRVWIGSEARGLLELSHVLIPAAGLVVALSILVMPALCGRPWLRAWFTIAALGCLYVAGEESSWGQHYFGWETSEGWRGVNDQGETNLHNVSGWFDQKPRALLEIGVVLGGIVLPLVGLWRPALLSGLMQRPIAVVIPPLICLPAAILAELVALTERIPRAFESRAFLFDRTSEVQELFFYLFVLFYLIALRRRLADRAAASLE